MRTKKSGMPMILSNSHRISKKLNISRKYKLESLIKKREIPFGSSEEYWAMNESLTQSMKNRIIKKSLKLRVNFF